MLPLPTYIVCRSSAHEAAWQSRSLHYSGLDFRPLVGNTSYYKIINEAIKSADSEALIIHDDVWLSIDIDKHVSSLISELNEKYPNWGLCGNAGMRWDGTISARHVSDPHGGPIPVKGPRPVMSIDGNVMLLNCKKMRERGLLAIPDLGGFHGYDLVLSYETLRNGLCVLIDGRIYAKHDSAGNQSGFTEFTSSSELQNYLSENFSDYRFDTLNGPIVLKDRPFRPIQKEQEEHEQKTISLIDCYDAAISSARENNPIKLAICVRTQFKRPYLLERFLISASNAIREAAALISTEIVLITDQPDNPLKERGAASERRFGGVDITHLSHKISEGRASRVDLAFRAFESVEADFVWFIDDDDYVLPSGICNIARSIYDKSGQLIVLDCLRASEQWHSDGHAEVLKSSIFLGRTNSAQVYEALRGDNFTPVCGVVYPRKMMQEKLKSVSGRTSYYEDYLLLLVALSCADVSVERIAHLCCGISVRGADNTVTEKDRTIWNISVATVLAEVQANRDLAVSFAWDVAHQTRENYIVESQRAVALRELGVVSGSKIRVGTASFSITQGMDIHGFVDSIEFEGDELLIAGWAVDLAATSPAEQVIISTNKEVIALLATHIPRPDVASELQLPLASEVGFRFRIKSTVGWDFSEVPEIFALSRGLAKKLRFSSAAAGTRFRQTVSVANNAMSSANFDEEFYLTRHPDVRTAVNRGSIPSAFSHWLLNGSEEGREFRFLNGIQPSKADVAAARLEISLKRKPESQHAEMNGGEPRLEKGKFNSRKILKAVQGRIKR